jgi:NAD(P)-dependent dehydrogenase (short-subunit alcohol dehydrogenase family)
MLILPERLPMYPGLENRVAVVTGAAQGIGRSTAAVLAENGVSVVGLDLHREPKDDSEPFDAVVDSGELVIGDVSDPDVVEELFERTQGYGEVSIVVNNAGVGGNGPIETVGIDAWRQTFKIHIEGTYQICRRALPGMVDANDGRIVNLSSVIGLIAYPDAADYAPAKGAIASLTRQLAADYSPEGVRVNAVAPGFVRTAMNADRWRDDALEHGLPIDMVRERTLTPHLGEPRDIGEVVAFLASNAARFITGQVIPVDGDWSA